MSTSELVEIEWPREQVALLRLNRPERLNALTYELVEAIVDAVTTTSADERCRVMIITGNGRGFCAGLDLGGAVDRQETQVRSIGVRLSMQEGFAAMARTIRTAPQPVIAAVNGPVAGAGMGMALACDIRLAATSASFHVAAVKIGLSAGECGISYHLPRYLGTARAFEVMLTGRPIPAEEAERFGLVSQLVADGEVVDAALAVAERILGNSPFAIRMTKQIMWRNIENDFDEAIELENRTQILATLTEDSKEAMKAFVEKRPPRYIGQ
jgi:enoyl-CoA hydratase